MKSGLYSGIALQNLRKNFRFYIPRILSEAGLLACFYIAHTLSVDKRMAEISGGDYVTIFMAMGTAVLAILSGVMMLYINSFLMKQRKREYGIYNILGMEKRHICSVMFFENLISSLISIGLGLILGVLFYKLCSLLICRLLATEIVAGFYYITPDTLLHAALSFLALDFVILLLNCISIGRLKPVELLASRSTGEREPKTKKLLLILGLCSLAGGYYISITTTSPLQALLLFFLAVLLVMLGTYCLFTAGSIFVLKCLKKNQNYYYNSRHMIAVSGLLYRMKQNAVGLASIAILATGVLVMISTTVSLYAGLHETIAKNYPQHYYLAASCRIGADTVSIPREVLRDAVTGACEENDVSISEIAEQYYLQAAFLLQGDTLSTDQSQLDLSALSQITFLPEYEYVRFGGSPLALQPDEIAIYSEGMTALYPHDTLRLGSSSFRVRSSGKDCPVNVGWRAAVTDYYVLIVADDAVMDEICAVQLAAYELNASDYTDRLAVTFASLSDATAAGPEIDTAVTRRVEAYLAGLGYEGCCYNETESVWEASENVYGMYGTLLFLGILLGLVCMFATVLIIYYKQISEGYEDRERYQIMQKIGMSSSEVKRSINAQVLLVFFLPLLTAGIHLIFAFPILERLLQILLLPKRMLFVICSVITFAVFAGIYTLIYTGTSRTYYKIVR